MRCGSDEVCHPRWSGSANWQRGGWHFGKLANGGGSIAARQRKSVRCGENMALPPVTEVAEGQQGAAEKGRPASAAGVRLTGPAALSLRGGRHCRSARCQG